MDLGTILGLLGGVGFILLGQILEHGNPMQLVQLTAAMIVFGGTFGAVFVSFPLGTVLHSIKQFVLVFKRKMSSPKEVIDLIVNLSARARKEGIVSLEQDVQQLEHPFMKKALSMAVDGAEVKEIRTAMEIEMHYMGEHDESGPKVWEGAGGYAPTIGILGAVIGLIQVMQNLSNIEEVGKGIAVAFVATIYGVGSANLVFLPAATKIKMINQAEARLREMILEGVLLIVEGVNPMIIRDRLASYLSGKDKPAPQEAEK